MVHVREGTDDDLLVVGILLDASMFGYNNEVRSVVSLVWVCALQPYEYTAGASSYEV